jgi:hypothetical protein
MKRFFLSAIISFIIFPLNAQVNLPCVDSTRLNPYFTCYLEYDPVCGCDSNSYRNYCWASNKSGINYYHPGLCARDFFGIDLVPNPVQHEPAQFSMAVRKPSPCYIYITDLFGGIVYDRHFFSDYDDEVVRFEIDMNDFRNGVYALIAVVHDEKKYIKFVKVKY